MRSSFPLKSSHHLFVLFCKPFLHKQLFNVRTAFIASAHTGLLFYACNLYAPIWCFVFTNNHHERNVRQPMFKSIMIKFSFVSRTTCFFVRWVSINDLAFLDFNVTIIFLRKRYFVAIIEVLDALQSLKIIQTLKFV